MLNLFFYLIVFYLIVPVRSINFVRESHSFERKIYTKVNLNSENMKLNGQKMAKIS